MSHQHCTAVLTVTPTHNESYITSELLHQLFRVA